MHRYKRNFQNLTQNNGWLGMLEVIAWFYFFFFFFYTMVSDGNNRRWSVKINGKINRFLDLEEKNPANIGSSGSKMVKSQNLSGAPLLDLCWRNYSPLKKKLKPTRSARIACFACACTKINFHYIHKWLNSIL